MNSDEEILKTIRKKMDAHDVIIKDIDSALRKIRKSINLIETVSNTLHAKNEAIKAKRQLENTVWCFIGAFCMFMGLLILSYFV